MTRYATKPPDKWKSNRLQMMLKSRAQGPGEGDGSGIDCIIRKPV